MSDKVDIYTTNQGDTWDNISYRVYGSEKYMKELMESNQDYIGVAIFTGGIEIICPDISTEDTASLPPWRQ